jgi:E1A/CREB-binding protein
MGFGNLLDKLSIQDVNIEIAQPNNTSNVEDDDPRMQAILRALDSLIHSSTCRDDSCTYGQCEKMKKIFNHARDCKLKTQKDCRICKQLIALCCFHAKKCIESDCNVTFCSNIKEKIRVYRSQQQQQR